ncbi:MAG: NADPH-dependent 2,4-dienoyl-CoA reductase [Pseudomonadota bacterium]
MPSSSLFAQSIELAGMNIPNRFVMGSMHTGLEGMPERFDELARFYAERAKGGVGLIVTGGFSPNFAGRIKDHPCVVATPEHAEQHRIIPDEVHKSGGRIILQLLHAGRYGYHSHIVAPSPIKSPINRDTPVELSHEEIEQTISDFANSAKLAALAGYDGVEIMGSEGYLMSQFLAPVTNHRSDQWGGDFENRMRFPLAVTAAVREALGPDRILSFRMSAHDLIDGGMTQDEGVILAQALEEAGADCISTGIGWHESAIPTISGAVPHGAFAEASAKLKSAVSIPVIASNRINAPQIAEEILQNNQADMISMARPMLADADFANKAVEGHAEEINICIACNQACLDHYFTDQVITCLVNPRAAREAEFNDDQAVRPKKIAVIGAGVAGIACALEASRRGHAVTLYEKSNQIGGQFLLAAKIPGKEDYGLSVEAFSKQLSKSDVRLMLECDVTAKSLTEDGFDEIVIASGITPRQLEIPGNTHPKVVGYTEILNGDIIAGDKVAIIGAGGIGHDVALFLSHPDNHSDPLKSFQEHWGVGQDRDPKEGKRQVTMLQRKNDRFGRTLGKSTGWILRQELKDYGVRQIAGVRYLHVDDNGLHIEVDGKQEQLDMDTIVVCAGQNSCDSFSSQLSDAGHNIHVIGGARLAGELDAQRAIDEGTRLGNAL